MAESKILVLVAVFVGLIAVGCKPEVNPKVDGLPEGTLFKHDSKGTAFEVVLPSDYQPTNGPVLPDSFNYKRPNGERLTLSIGSHMPANTLATMDDSYKSTPPSDRLEFKDGSRAWFMYFTGRHAKDKLPTASALYVSGDRIAGVEIEGKLTQSESRDELESIVRSVRIGPTARQPIGE